MQPETKDAKSSLVAGSGLRFDDRSARALKGMPGEWRLFVDGRA